MLGVLGVFLVLQERQAANEGVSVQFVCVTNAPGLAPQALFKITNRTQDLMICYRYGFLRHTM
jgi:hypothetical protein